MEVQACHSWGWPTPLCGEAAYLAPPYSGFCWPQGFSKFCLFWAQCLSNRAGSLRTLPTLTFSEVKNRPRLPPGPTASLLDIGGCQLWFQSCDSSGTVLPESCIEPCLKCSCLSPMSREVALGRRPGDYLQ